MGAPFITRRAFLAAAATTGTAILAACGGATAPTITPQPSPTLPPQPTLTPIPTLPATTPPTPTPLPTALPTSTPQPSPTATLAPTVTPIPSPTPKAQPTTLREAAEKRGIRIGTINTQSLFARNTSKVTRVSENFNELFTDLAVWSMTPKTADKVLGWVTHDSALVFANRYNMSVQMAGLWDAKSTWPDWLANDTRPLAEFNQFFVDVITSAVNHDTAMQPDLPITLNVVNEIIYQYNRKNSLLRARNGGTFEWVDALFKAAERANPKTKRHWNDHDNYVQNGISNQQYEEMQKMRERGVPIDGIGIQVYIDAAQPVDPMAMAKNVARFVSAGFDVSVPEFAISSQNLKGTDSERFAVQAKMYGETVQALLDGGCKDITIFGETDGEIANNPFGTGNKDAQAGIFDRDGNPKPAYQAIFSVLMKR